MFRRSVPGRVASATLLAALVLPLSGCYEADVTAAVDHESETISGTIVVGAQEAYAKSVLRTKDPEEVIEAAHVEMMVASLLPKGTTVEPWTGDGVVGTKITFTDHPLDKMPLNIPPMGATIDVAHEGDEYVLDATIDPAKTGLPSYFLDPSKTSFEITFPGDITETNGKADGSTVTWEFEGDAALHLTATSTEKPSLVSAAKRNLWAPAAALAGLGLIVLAGYAVARDAKRKRAVMPRAAGKKGLRGTTDTHVPPPKLADTTKADRTRAARPNTKGA